MTRTIKKLVNTHHEMVLKYELFQIIVQGEMINRQKETLVENHLGVVELQLLFVAAVAKIKMVRIGDRTYRKRFLKLNRFHFLRKNNLTIFL